MAGRDAVWSKVLGRSSAEGQAVTAARDTEYDAASEWVPTASGHIVQTRLRHRTRHPASHGDAGCHTVPNMRTAPHAGEGPFLLLELCAPGRIRTCAPASGGRCSIP